MPAALALAAQIVEQPLADVEASVRRNLPLLLLQVRERVISRFRPILNEYGVTEQQYRVMRSIQASGPMEPREIVLTCHISSPSLAGMLLRMETMGLVARRRFAHDQRRIMVSLTPASRALFRRMRPRIDAMYESLETDAGSALTADLYRTLNSLLARLSIDAQDACDD